jgi:hypothetical protein
MAVLTSVHTGGKVLQDVIQSVWFCKLFLFRMLATEVTNHKSRSASFVTDARLTYVKMYFMDSQTDYNIKVFCDQQMHNLLTYKMLKFTNKTSVYLLLHVSVHTDHLQGAHVGPC